MFWNKKKYDFVAIGETTIDAFIRLEEATVECDENKENCKLCVGYGAKIPYEFVVEVPAVGNAANASVSASRLGLASALVANIGNDRNGELCINSLKNDGVSTDFIRKSDNKNTNYHYVLWYQDERTILQKHSDFDYTLPDLGGVKWIYLTSLGEKSLPFHDTLGEFLKKNPEIKLAFQPGIFQIKIGSLKLKNIYERTDLFFCNIEEAHTILNIPTHIEIPELIKKVRELGPKIVVLTDGTKGAYSYDGENMFFMPAYPDPKPPYERTGAGDAFSSTFTSALIAGKSIEESLMWAPINSMAVVQQIGAQKGLLSKEKLLEYLKNAPADYKPRKI